MIEGGRECKSKRKVEDSGFDEQEETVPPMKKLKQQVCATCSNSELDHETERLRLSLEELLHIGFCGNLIIIITFITHFNKFLSSFF
ncbi:hypothetical protein P8452_55566 [Trifolium repens]|nr:hypothetical protein P8452_55566 [Trifolium repens]